MKRGVDRIANDLESFLKELKKSVREVEQELKEEEQELQEKRAMKESREKFERKKQQFERKNGLMVWARDSDNPNAQQHLAYLCSGYNGPDDGDHVWIRWDYFMGTKWSQGLGT